MTTYLSNKLRAISFLAIVLVVILHSELSTYSEGYSYQFQKMISSEMTRISVPIFFYISGFLLFYNFKSLSYSWYISKLKKRCITLLIPFLIWSIYGFIVVYSIKFVLPSAFNSYQPLKNYEVIDFLQAFFWTPVGCYQLWFIRDLFLCIILSPILYIGLRYLKEFFLILLFLFWFLDIYYVISIDSLLFITLGAYVALNHKSYMEKVTSKKPILLLGFFWVFFCVLDYNFPFFNIVHGIAILLGGDFYGVYMMSLMLEH